MKGFIKFRTLKPSLLILLFLLAQQSHAAVSRNDVKLQEASEDIKFISQQMVKDYFYLSFNPEKKEIKENLNEELLLIDSNLRLIAASTTNKSTKKILTFLAYSRDQITETINMPYSAENSAIILDYSEILLEGAERIAKVHSYAFSKEENMLINVKNMAYLLERMSKYYMVFQAGFRDHNNIKQLQDAVTSFDTLLGKVNEYDYNSNTAEDLNNINRYWKVARSYYLSLEKSNIPNILYISVEYLENNIVELELYHSKNL
ncbi:MAG: hypothetical protein U9R26_03600 [Campylobacterota bacterium]|nr:hypothetical protein [Campylobacterota bacterium]